MPAGTVLIIDDELLVRNTARLILETAGYSVFTSEGYDDAIRTFQDFSEVICLAVVDVSLPARNGCDLAAALRKLNPQLKVLFISGYVGAEILGYYGISKSNIHFLAKPFLAKQLTDRVREVLDSTEPMQWSHTASPANLVLITSGITSNAKF